MFAHCILGPLYYPLLTLVLHDQVYLLPNTQPAREALAASVSRIFFHVVQVRRVALRLMLFGSTEGDAINVCNACSVG